MSFRKCIIKILIFVLALVLMSFFTACDFGKSKSWEYNSEVNVDAAEKYTAFTGVRNENSSDVLPKLIEPFRVIDVSAWQEDVDFKAVKESGVKGVILRLARYNMEKDGYFDINYTKAKQNGLLVGCYYFMGAQSIEESYEEAQKVIRLLDEKKYELELPVFYDVEDEHGSEPGNITMLDNQLLTDMVKTFCDTLIENGYYSGYYCNLKFARTELFPVQLTKYPFWVARWSDNNACVFPYLVWQYSATGNVPGVEGDCDMDLCFADFETYIRENGYNNLKK
ncbi:MAG: hypothetical protein E7384_00180 [Ruminococcaceae bacterium]|nr:hypothetical protein [Oscillospiraceae bacterium]